MEAVPPPTPDPNTIHIPLVALQGVQLRIDTFPDGARMLVIGPVALGIQLTQPIEDWLKENLKASSGLVIARVGDIKLESVL